jgi:hypothetical protein
MFLFFSITLAKISKEKCFSITLFMDKKLNQIIHSAFFALTFQFIFFKKLGFQYTFIKKVKGSIKSVLDLNN